MEQGVQGGESQVHTIDNLDADVHLERIVSSGQTTRLKYPHYYAATLHNKPQPKS